MAAGDTCSRRLQERPVPLRYVGNADLIVKKTANPGGPAPTNDNRKKDPQMPAYHDLRPAADFEERGYALVFPKMTVTEKKRTIRNLLVLKEGLAEIPTRRTEDNLLVASWNIKEFGHTTQRLPEAYFYIAEIIAMFDLVAVQEIKSTVFDLDIIMRLLGSDWRFLVNDITNGTDGNSERSAYIFNTARVKLSGLAGEISLWEELTADSDLKQLKRAPYITGFCAGWKTFAMVNLHLHPGDDDDDIELRKEEVRLLLAAIAEKRRLNQLFTDNLILVGDFNLYDDHDDETIALIEDAGFFEIESLKDKDTNASKTESYDRFFLRRNEYFQINKDENGAEIAGVFDPFLFVYQDGKHNTYKSQMKSHYTGEKTEAEFLATIDRYYKHPWRKNQLSDHFPIWFDLNIDSSERFLETKLDEL